MPKKTSPKQTKSYRSRTSSETVQHHDPEILHGMSRGPWSVLWANYQEEAGASFSGQDIYELAPEAPAWAKEWARKLASAIVQLNGNFSLEQIYRAAQGEGFARDKEAFGYYLGMQSAGHGVAWDDDISGATLKIRHPSSEFYEGVRDIDMRFIQE
jgi:hypothetical protein